MNLKEMHLCCFMLFFIIINISDASRLSQLHSTIIKSIKSEDGDVIDCVDIYHQPAFDHPLLKDHTIEMAPSNHPGLFAPRKLSNFESNDNNQIIQLWQLSGECPEGSIPIRRTEKGAIFIKKKPRSISRGFSSVGTNSVDQFLHEYSITFTKDDKYFGAMATISVWQPHVEMINEFSLSQIWIEGGSGSNLNTIEVGWTVNPQLFGDNLTRLFIYWTTDNYQSTGCFNLLCSGFVQTCKKIAIGGSISTSGNNQEISLIVWKDIRKPVWWLQYNSTILGYWPATLFTVLNGSASGIEWGGEIINSNIDGRHTATQMGSGHFPEAGFGRASYFRNLQVVNIANTLVPPANVQGDATNPNCYNVAAGKNNDWGNFFYYGGPGRNPNCP